MKANNKFFMRNIALVLLLHGGNSITAQNQSTDIIQVAALAEEAQAHGIQALRSRQPEKIKHPSMNLIDLGFRSNPSGILRIDLTLKTIEKVFKNIDKFKSKSLKDNNEQKFVEQGMNAVLKPVQPFFDELEKMNAHKIAIKPIEESLVKNAKMKDSLLLKFFASKNKDKKATACVEDFCKKEIATLDALEKMCVELKTFFQDIRASISEKTQEKVAEAEKRLKERKAKRQQKVKEKQ